MPGTMPTTLPDSSESGQKHGSDPNTADRITELPDTIIGEILSFLPTNNAVATGILSKRWKGLWTLAGNLDFSCPKNFTGSVEHFVEFVNSVLLSRKHGCFQRLSLTWETGCIPNYVDTWICAALDRNVSELFVCAELSKLPIQMQSSLFRSESLKSLELDCNICISSCETVFNLPRLERLKLISVYFHSDKAVGKILKGCPVLKYLIIHMDVGKMVENGYFVAVDNEAKYGDTMNPDYSGISCVLSSASLTHLEISVNAFNSSPKPRKVLWCADLDVPSLRYIKLDGFLLCIWIQQRRLAFLEEANIEINGPLSGESHYCNALVRAFGAFRCAKTLTLHDQVIRALRYAPVKMITKFNALTRLEVSIDCSYRSSLQDFMMLSDNLEVLILQKYGGLETDDVSRNNNSNANQKKLDIVPRCLSKSLQTVSISGYYGHCDELAMIAYIIKHARVLKIMEIGLGETISDFKRKYELAEEICALPRKSTICEVKVLDCC